MFLVISRWLGFRLDLICFGFLVATVFAAVALKNELDPGLVGLSLILAIRLTGNFQWCVRQSAEIENSMTSVERVLEYTKVQPEEESILPGSDVPQPVGSTNALLPASRMSLLPSVPQGWPSSGRVEFRNVTMKYAEGLPPALNNVSFRLESGQKLGVIGRTGAGKSSLLTALFRLTSHIQGT
jgi:ATP-binding cassette subfamily C (CFTR/MRP) protein 4